MGECILHKTGWFNWLMMLQFCSVRNWSLCSMAWSFTITVSICSLTGMSMFGRLCGYTFSFSVSHFLWSVTMYKEWILSQFVFVFKTSVYSLVTGLSTYWSACCLVCLLEFVFHSLWFDFLFNQSSFVLSQLNSLLSNVTTHSVPYLCLIVMSAVCA